MNTSEQGLQLIMEREGKRNEAYPDTRGIPTIGVGHTGPDVTWGLIWTDQQVMDALKRDMAWVEGCIASKVAVELEQYEHDALASFIFNLGEGQFASSTLLRLLNEHAPPAEVAAQFDRWHSPPEIISRRNAEKAQFMGEQFVARI